MYGPKAILVVHSDVPTWFAFFANWINLGGAISNAMLYVLLSLESLVLALALRLESLLYVVLHQTVRDELRKLFRRRLQFISVGSGNAALPVIRY